MISLHLPGCPAFLLAVVCSLAGAADFTIVTVGPSAGQPSGTGNGGASRYTGNPISLNIAFSAATSATFDLTKIHLYKHSDHTAILNSGPLSLSVADGAASTQWKLTFVPVADDDADLVFDAGAFTSSTGVSLLASTTTITLDLIPQVRTTYAVSASAIAFTVSVPIGLEAAEPVNLSSAFIAVQNGSRDAGTANADHTATTYVVTPFGYGDVTFTAGAGTIRDKWNNQNVAATTTVNFPAGIPGSAPHIIAVRGTSPQDRIYRDGDIITLAVDFDRAVQLKGSGAPYLLLNAGSGAIATYSSGNNTQTLTFSYTVLAGQRSAALDLASHSAFTLPDQAGLAGTATSPDFLADVTVPTGQLPANSFYSINVEPSKPLPQDIAGTSADNTCGAGSGIALVLGLGSLTAFGLRRRRAA